MRLGAIILTAIFLLIPLLSSPVAAAFTYTSTGNYTNNTPNGPTAFASCPPPYSFEHESQPLAEFEMWYHFEDSNEEGAGSMHQATITVTPLPSGTPVSITSFWVFLEPGKESSNHITIGPIAYTPPASWKVEVLVECWDFAMGFSSYVSDYDECIVEVE